MDGTAAGAVVQRYRTTTREALLWKLDGLSEYDVRRPLTPTGTNLLGLVKHLTITEAWYFGEGFGRPVPETMPRRAGQLPETTLRGLVKHLTSTEAWCFGEVFGRPVPETLPWRDGDAHERDGDA